MAGPALQNQWQKKHFCFPGADVRNVRASRCHPSALCSVTLTLLEQGSGFSEKRWEQSAHQRVGSQLTWQDKGSKAPASPGFSVFSRSTLCVCTTPWIYIHSSIPKLKRSTYFLLGSTVRYHRRAALISIFTLVCLTRGSSQ